jgi:hypothetical protein
MATITPATTYPNGAALDIAGHNANVYSTTSGQGILSEPNGGLNINNLNLAFNVLDEHVMPEEATFARMDGTTVPMDVYNNAFGQRADQDSNYVSVGGLCERIYVPFDVAFGVWQWAFYMAPWRPFIYNFDTEEASIPDMALRVYIDGVEQPAFRRYMSVSAETDADSFGNAAGSTAGPNHEQVTPLWFEISKLATNVTKGFHELSVKLWLPRIDYVTSDDDAELTLDAGLGNFAVLLDGSTVTSDVVETTLHTRVSFGTRNARFVAFK